MIRASIAATVLLLLAAPAAAEPLEIASRGVPLDWNDPERLRVGQLEYRGGLELASTDARFGGLSGLLVSADGAELTAVTDQGHWVTARLAYDQGGRLSGLTEAAIGPLHAPSGAHLTDKQDQDSEGLARLPDGSIAVSFERHHRIWRYPGGKAPLTGRPRALPAPAGLESLRSNSGVEALVTLADGSLLAIAEGRKENELAPAYLWRDGAWATLGYRRHGALRPTGATRLPNGDLLVIERSFNFIDGVTIRLSRVPGASVVPGATLDGEMIAVLRQPLNIDNLEGVAVRRSETGETLIYLVSDDNFRPLQSNLLLMFALVE